jgi:hypothetical protein
MAHRKAIYGGNSTIMRWLREHNERMITVMLGPEEFSIVQEVATKQGKGVSTVLREVALGQLRLTKALGNTGQA